MTKLGHKQQSFVQMMARNEELAQRGFELLAARNDCDHFFDAIAEIGLLKPENNPKPVPSSEPGYFQIPYWGALTYLEAVSKVAGDREDYALAAKVMAIVRNVTCAAVGGSSDGDNYHTFRKFAELLAHLPTRAVSVEDLDLVRHWLKSKFDRGLVGQVLGMRVLPRYLASESAEDWRKATVILSHCSALEPTTDNGRKKYRAAIDDYWLEEIFKANAEALGRKVPQETVNELLPRIRTLFPNSRPTWLLRPAIEEHEQNHKWRGVENAFVQVIRDVLLNWVSHDIETAKPAIRDLLGDKSEIVRRLAIHVFNESFELLLDLFPLLLKPLFFKNGHLHEMYRLLKSRFFELDKTHQSEILRVISKLKSPRSAADRVRRAKLIQRTWLSAIAGQGHQVADESLRSLLSDPTLPKFSEHPDFNAYTQSFIGPGPTPYQVSDLILFAREGSLIERLHSFKETNIWEGPTTRALCDTLEAAVVAEPLAFVTYISSAADAGHPYKYSLISGYKQLWADEKRLDVDWDVIWPQLITLFGKLLRSPKFWSDKVEPDESLTPNRDWIPPLISDFLRAGTHSDQRSYKASLLPRTWKLINILLEKSDSVGQPAEDAMTQAINSTKGKAIEALVNHALRKCRLADKRIGTHHEAWTAMERTFQRELDLCVNANFEFSTLAGAYISNFQYMSGDWVKQNLSKIFPGNYSLNFSCAIEGLAYAPATKPLYKLLRGGGVLEAALSESVRGHHAKEKLIQRIALAYLWGEETLDSYVISNFFRSEDIGALEIIASFYWQVSDQNLSEEQKERVIQFWDHSVQWAQSLNKTPSVLLSSLGRLAGYITNIGSREEQLLLAVAPYVHVGHNADEFVEQLDRLFDNHPAEIAAALDILLRTYRPVFDLDDKLKSLITKLKNRGMHAEAVRVADQLRNLPGVQKLYNQF